MKVNILAALAAAFLISASSASADGDNNGQAIGQDDQLLAATKCANNGGGNLGEYLIGGECYKGIGEEDTRLTRAECVDAEIGDRRQCTRLWIRTIRAERRGGTGPLSEIDPGNSD